MNYKNALIYILLSCLFFSCSKKKINVSHSEMQLNTSNTLNTVRYINDSIGFAAGGDRYILSDIFKTTDAGKTWIKYPITINFSKSIFDIAQLPNGNLLAAGVSGFQFLSTDTGATWQPHQISNWQEVQKMFVQGNKIFMAQGLAQGGNITIQDNNLNNISVSNFNGEIDDVKMFNDSLGYASGLGAVYRTVDAGASWNVTNATGDLFKSIICLGKHTIITVGYNGSIRKSTDDGNNWKDIKTANGLSGKDRFNNMVMIDSQYIYAVGENGLIAQIDYQNNSYKIVKKFTSNNIKYICKKNSTTLALVGDNGLYAEIIY